MTINAKESKTDKFKLASIVLALTTVASLALFFIAATAYESKNAALIAETDSHLETIKSLRQSTELAKVFIAKTTALSEQILESKKDGKVIEILTTKPEVKSKVDFEYHKSLVKQSMFLNTQSMANKYLRLKIAGDDVLINKELSYSVARINAYDLFNLKSQLNVLKTILVSEVNSISSYVLSKTIKEDMKPTVKNNEISEVGNE